MANSSRKRKSTVLDQQGSKPFDGSPEFVSSGQRENLTYLWLKDSNPQHKIGLLTGMNVHENTPKAVLNQNDTGPEFRKCHFQEDTVDEMKNAYDGMKPSEFQCNETSPFHKSPSKEILAPQHVTQNAACQSELDRFQPYSGFFKRCTEKMGAFPSLKDGTNLGQNSVFCTNSFLSMPHESLTALEESQTRTTKSTEFVHNEDATAGTCILDLGTVGSAVLVKSNDKFMNAVESRDISIAETGTSSQTLGSDGKESYGFYQYPKTEESSGTSPGTAASFNVKDKDEEQVVSFSYPMRMPMESSDSEKRCVGAGKLNDIVLVSEDREIKMVDIHGGSNVKSEKHLTAGSSARKPPNHGDDPSHVSVKYEGKSIPHAGKVASKVIEKLWEGSIQLNTSVTVSAIAYFKSGEKAPKFNWSKHVAVKGKVRLEAFEKYIQELPRSRNRALMVTSLCWKVGSSKNGLTGIKEVTKDYNEEKKVGFAQLAPSVDLYVCPRSDTIITILAKYGFFKGMAAVDDDQDSLIGCVVWRRNRLSSNSVSKKPERKNITSEKPLNSPSSAILQGANTYSPVMSLQDSNANHGNQGFKSSAVGPHISDMSSASPLSERYMAAESKNSQLVQDSQANHDNQYFKSSPIDPRISDVRSAMAAPAIERDVAAESKNSQSVQDSVANHGDQCSKNSPTDPHISDIRSATPVHERDMAAESKNTQSSKDPLDVDAPFTSPIRKSTPLVQVRISPVISKGPRAATKPHSSSVQDSIGQLLKVENTTMHAVESKKTNAGLALLEHSLPGLSQMLLKAEQKMSSPDDDDLPEFDFRTACGGSQLTDNKLLSSTNKAHFSDGPPIYKKAPAEGIGNLCGPMAPVQSIMRPVFSNQQLLPSSTHQGFGSDTHQGVPMSNKPGDPALRISLWPDSEQKPSVHRGKLISSAAMKLADAVATPGADSRIIQKNLWDDDDDMPEWCPPDLEHTTQPPFRVSRGPSDFSSAPRTTPEKVTFVPSGPQMQFQPPMIFHPSLRPQGLPLGFQPRFPAQRPVNSTVMPPVRPLSAAVQLGPRYAPGPSPNLTLTPPSSLFEVKLNIRPVDWKGSRS